MQLRSNYYFKVFTWQTVALITLLSRCCVSSHHKSVSLCPSDFSSSSCLTSNINHAFSKLSSQYRFMYLEQGQHLIKDSQLVSVSGVVISGTDKNSSLVCTPGSGLTLSFASNVTLSNLTITGCGQVVLGTQFAALTTALFIHHSDDITISNVVIRDTVGVGLFGVNVGGRLSLHRVHFVNNTSGRDSQASVGMGGGAFLIWGSNTNSDNLFDHCPELIQSHFIPNSNSVDYVISTQNIHALVDTEVVHDHKDEHPKPAGVKAVSRRTLIDNCNITIASSRISAMPGQSFDLSVSVLCSDQQPVIVTSAVVNGDAQVEGGPWLINGTSIVSLSARGTPYQNITISLSTFNGPEITAMHAEASIELIPCTSGFVFNERVNYGQCLCKRELVFAGISCDVDGGSLLIPTSLWFGSLMEENGIPLGYANCLEGYCKQGTVSISHNDFDYQCRSEFHRSGVACGSCASGYSAVFGSVQCQQCSNRSLLLIMLFGLTGIMTILIMFVLNITLTTGYLNSVLLHSNIVTLLKVTPSTGKGVFVISAWISQSIGIPTCFYNGMPTLSAFGLQFAYIGYLFIAFGCIALLAKRRIKPDLIANVLGTLLALCYTAALQTSISLLSFTHVTTLSGEESTRWYFDPNVHYFEGTHLVLCLLAILILVFYLIPLPLLAISPRLTSVKLLHTLKPLLTTYWSPFKSRFQWWFSFRLLIRCIAVFISMFVTSPNYILGVDMVIILLLFLQSHVRPFCGFWQGLFDDTLLLNIVLIFSGSFFFSHTENALLSQSDGLIVYGSIFVVMGYAVYVTVFIILIVIRFPKLKDFILHKFHDQFLRASPASPAEMDDVLLLEGVDNAEPPPEYPHGIVNNKESDFSRTQEQDSPAQQATVDGARGSQEAHAQVPLDDDERMISGQTLGLELDEEQMMLLGADRMRF